MIQPRVWLSRSGREMFPEARGPSEGTLKREEEEEPEEEAKAIDDTACSLTKIGEMQCYQE